MNDDLSGKAILVTGAGRRVGAVIARVLHAAGAMVALHYLRSASGATALAAEMNSARPGSAVALRADLLDVSTLSELVDGALRAFGRLDGLVNNASSFYPTPLGRIDLAAWEDLVGSNFRAPLFLAQAAAPALTASSGTIVNITDIHGERPLAGYPLYSAAKGALLTLTRALAIELAPQVRVNAVSPGPVLWPEDQQFEPAARRQIIEHTLLKREGTAADIAAAVLFLLNAGFISGQVINVDGGRTAYL